MSNRKLKESAIIRVSLELLYLTTYIKEMNTIKTMKTFCLICLCLWATLMQAQVLDRSAFELLNLDYPGLEKVKTACDAGDTFRAAEELLAYYRSRTGVSTPDLDLEHLSLSERERGWADDALEHTFYVHDGYQPPFNYGKDIDWRYWPVQDNELRWQLHRHKWFTPMGKAYRLTGDEKYAREWVLQYADWIKKNPLVEIPKALYELQDDAEGEAENVRFAWRPLEASHRLQDQINQFLLFLPSPSFTPAFLTQFLSNYHRHALHVMRNYSAEGNHLLFEAQRVLYAGAFFPEFKEAAGWRKSGIDILNREIKKQVYPDGGQYELDLHYHPACIDIFCKALRMADVNGFRSEFPQSYTDTIESMIVFYMNLCFPDYTNPCFSDAKRGSRKGDIARYKAWAKLFPDNAQIRYFATEGKEGLPPANLSKGFLDSGFFAFRNGWGKDATVMVIKAGPAGEWHSQPDNGTFELWVQGKNLFPDSGSYVYEGNEEVTRLRNWFRRTASHNTLTLDGKNLEDRVSHTKSWQPEGEVQSLVTEHESYKGLTHRRTFFFIEGSYFVIVDEALGDATGTVNLNWHLCDGKVNIDPEHLTLSSAFEGDVQVKLQCFAPRHTVLKEEEGWYSTAYRQRTERTSVSLNTPKASEPLRYITVICPYRLPKGEPKIKARFAGESRIEVSVDGQKRTLAY